MHGRVVEAEQDQADERPRDSGDEEASRLQPVAAAFQIMGGGHLDINALVPALQDWLGDSRESFLT